MIAFTILFTEISYKILLDWRLYSQASLKATVLILLHLHLHSKGFILVVIRWLPVVYMSMQSQTSQL